MNVYEQILHNRAAGRKMIAVLLDPDKCPAAGVGTLCRRVSAAAPDFVFVGGSGGVQAVDDSRVELSVPDRYDYALADNDLLPQGFRYRKGHTRYGQRQDDVGIEYLCIGRIFRHTIKFIQK